MWWTKSLCTFCQRVLLQACPLQLPWHFHGATCAETHTQVLPMNHLLSLCLREVRIWVNTVFFLASLKTEIARSAWGRKITRAPCRRRIGGAVLRAKFLVIWLQQMTKFSVKDVNFETIIDMQWVCKTWPPKGSNRIRAKQKLLRKHKGVCKSFWSQIGNLKSFILTIPWNLAKPVKIFPGIIARLHHIYRRPMGLPKEQCAE